MSYPTSTIMISKNMQWRRCWNTGFTRFWKKSWESISSHKFSNHFSSLRYNKTYYYWSFLYLLDIIVPDDNIALSHTEIIQTEEAVGVNSIEEHSSDIDPQLVQQISQSVTQTVLPPLMNKITSFESKVLDRVQSNLKLILIPYFI